MAAIVATLPTLALVALALSGVVFLCTVAVFVRKLAERLVRYLLRPLRAKRREKIDNLLKAYDARLIDRLPQGGSDCRDYLVSMAQNVEGDIAERLLHIYRQQGFLAADLGAINSSWQHRRVAALARLRAFRFPLGDQQWQQLMSSAEPWFRWAVMDYLVMVQGKNSFRWLALYLGGSMTVPQGNLMHLIARYGQTHAESLPFILEHWQDGNVRRAVLKTLSLYPVPGSAEAIRRSFHLLSPPEVILVGLNALKVHPDFDNITFLQQFSWHEDWRVRLHLVDAISSYPSATELLDILALDGCFEVRCQAASALVQLGAEDTIAAIVSQKDHPCRPLFASAATGRSLSRTFRVA